MTSRLRSELMRSAPAPTVAAWVAERDTKDMFLTAISEAELLYTALPSSRPEGAETNWKPR